MSNPVFSGIGSGWIHLTFYKYYCKSHGFLEPRSYDEVFFLSSTLHLHALYQHSPFSGGLLERGGNGVVAATQQTGNKLPHVTSYFSPFK